MRISDGAKEYGITVEPARLAPGEVVYRVKDIFTTRNGSWEPSGVPGSVPSWARDTYLKPPNHPQYNTDGGADHHLFGAVMLAGGALDPTAVIHYFTYTDDRNHADMRVKPHGWANIPIFGHSAVPGPWAWYPLGRTADIVKGGGMPNGAHVSFFAVWEAVAVPVLVPPLDPPTAPPTLREEIALLKARVTRIEELLAKWDGGR